MKENKSCSVKLFTGQIFQLLRQFTAKICYTTQSTSKVVWISIIVLTSILYGLHVFWTHRIFSLNDAVLLVETSTAPISSFNPRCKTFSSHNNQVRCLPNLFYIGASKTGTTSLVRILQTMPNVFFTRRFLTLPLDKHQEIHRFDRPNYPSSILSWELMHEWASSPLIPSTNDTAVVHYTPHYLYAPSVPFDLARFYPASLQSKIKFLVTLRDPCDRAISSYWFKHSHLFRDKDEGDTAHMIRSFAKEIATRSQYELCILQFHRDKGRYHTSFKIPEITTGNASVIRETYLLFLRDMIDTAQQLLRFGYPPIHYSANRPIPANVRVSGLYLLQEDHEQALQECFGSKNYRSPKLGLRHVDKSIYIDQFARWMLHFPFEHFIVLSSEEMGLNMEASVDNVLRQLSLNRTNSIKYNFSQIEKHLVKPNQFYQSLPNEDRQRLEHFFQPYQLALNAILDKYRKSS